MALYEPGQCVLLYEENGYRVTVNSMCLTIDFAGLRRHTAEIHIGETHPELRKRLIGKGYDPKDFVYVPYVLIRAAAKDSIEEFEKSLKKYDSDAYVRSLLPYRNQ
jgi:hypothetical protein